MNPIRKDFAESPRTMLVKPGAHGADLADLADYLLANGPRRVLPAPRRIRVILNHTFIIDVTKAVHVWEHDAYPQYYFPLSALKNCSIQDMKPVRSDGLPRAAIVQLTVPGPDGVADVVTDRVLRFEDDKSLGALAGLVRLEFGSMDQFLEEDLPIYVHPKDPFKRVDILPSSRPIKISIHGTTLAKSNFSVHLHETSLPVRYYLPLASVDQSILRKSDLITKCPYKGDAEYYHVFINGKEKKDLVWYYRLPTHESAAVAGMVCFYGEKVDTFIDDELLERPVTPFF